MMGYGKESWGKQITARFRPAELAQLDALVAKAKSGMVGYRWTRPTRSSVLVQLVVAAAAKSKPTPAKPNAKGGRR